LIIVVLLIESITFYLFKPTQKEINIEIYQYGKENYNPLILNYLLTYINDKTKFVNFISHTNNIPLESSIFNKTSPNYDYIFTAIKSERPVSLNEQENYVITSLINEPLYSNFFSVRKKITQLLLLQPGMIQSIIAILLLFTNT
jgi:hypothetical protein